MPFLLILIAVTALPGKTGVTLASAPKATLCTTAPTGPDPSATVCVSRDIVVFNAQSQQNHFDVSWVSAVPEVGQVQLVGGSVYNDTRGASFSGITHYVEINNVRPNQPYQFDIISGGKTFTNNGAHWSISTGPALNPRAPSNSGPALGKIKNPDGSNATDALVYISIRDADNLGSPGTSSLLSQVLTAEDAGFFHIDLTQARTADEASYFLYSESGDKLVIRAIGSHGSAAATVDTSIPRPGKPTFTLTLSSNGTGTAATATRSPIPPTITPTPTVPTATATIAPATKTSIAATQVATSIAATQIATSLAATQTQSAITATATEVPPSATATATSPAQTRAPRPRPTATRQLFVEPTLVKPGITVQPADATESAAPVSETPTEVSPVTPESTEELGEPTLESTEESAPPTSTLVIRRATATPISTSLVGGIVSGSSPLVAVALIAFVGASVLGIAALFVWRK